MTQLFYVPFTFPRALDSIMRYARVRTVSTRHAEWLVMRHYNNLRVRVYHEKIVGY